MDRERWDVIKKWARFGGRGRAEPHSNKVSHPAENPIILVAMILAFAFATGMAATTIIEQTVS